MSHGKVHSQGCIPFAWEDKPGVCKTLNHESSTDIGSKQTSHKKSSAFVPPQKPNLNLDSTKRSSAVHDMKIPLPPCPSQLRRRSTAGKGFKWQEDPFLVAYNECTKDGKMGKLPSTENKKGVRSSFNVRKSMSVFSCRSSTDVRDDTLLKLSQLPRLPSDRNGSSTT